MLIKEITTGNFGGVIYPKLPHEEVLDAISSWEYSDTPIELSNGYVINAREEGYNEDDNAWVLLDPQGKIVDAGEGSIEDVMQDFTPIAIEEETIEEKATIPVKGYTDAEEFINDFWFYGHNPSEMVSHTGPRARPTWIGIEDPKHSQLNKFLDANELTQSKLYDDELEVVLWLAKQMNISPMTVLRYGSDAIRFNTDTIKAVKQIVAKSKGK